MTKPTYSDFDSAGRAVIAFLHKRLGFGLWMVTRVQGADWIVLQSEDHGYNVAPGRVFRWADSFCSQMVKGNGPRIAPDSQVVPAYAAAPIGKQVDIGAYIGVPMTSSDGDLFGTLCAIDPDPQPGRIEADLELVELLAGLLGTVLQSDLRAIDATRRGEQLKLEAHTDSLTSLFNRRAWDQLLAKEEERCRRYGHSAAVVVIDLDGLKHVNDTLGHEAGDDMLIRTAAGLRAAARDTDVVARLGGDEFGILAIECDAKGAESLDRRTRGALERVGVTASYGMAVRKPGASLTEAAREADQLMYEQKARRCESGLRLRTPR